MKRSRGKNKTKKDKPNIFGLLKPYKVMVVLLIFFTLLSNGANLVIPKIISYGIDSYSNGNYALKSVIFYFMIAAAVIFVFTILQMVAQAYTSERVALNLRKSLSDKISGQSFAFIQDSNPSKLLTNLTSDMDSIKMFVAQGVTNIVSSIFMIVGICVLLLSINWELAIPVILSIPVIGITFFFILKKVRPLFKRGREVIDWLNKVINESILGAAIIRVINSQQLEYRKFLEANTEARDVGIGIVTMFATLIPIITFVANLATLTILALGGHFVIQSRLTLGEFAAFNSYVAILIFPIIVIGFMSNLIAQASASYERIDKVLRTPEIKESGTIERPLKGEIKLNNVSVFYNDKPALKDVSFLIESGSRTAIIGPTAAGKSQLLYLLTGLIQCDSGSAEFDGNNISEYKKQSFHEQIGFV
ncbi:MAG TPA: ABC transporter ATP-binding protein, partial [Draconibacterium sp.]|nr:ABC transporter ATP-binding protein [Draconibacterium sp.]